MTEHSQAVLDVSEDQYRALTNEAKIAADVIIVDGMVRKNRDGRVGLTREQWKAERGE